MSNSAGFSEKPAIFVSGNDVYVAWDDFTPGSTDIFYSPLLHIHSSLSPAEYTSDASSSPPYPGAGSSDQGCPDCSSTD
ncbi:MAG TPA: hypothetical protein VH796_12305 [Nitrososphaeraceae archaeon]